MMIEVASVAQAQIRIGGCKMSFLTVLSLILIVLKLTGMITISWLIALLPLGIHILIYVLLIVIACWMDTH